MFFFGNERRQEKQRTWTGFKRKEKKRKEIEIEIRMRYFIEIF